jgi:tyrosine-protein kinase Etk/Wzc
MKAQLAAQEVQLATYRRQFTESSQEVKNLTTSVGNLRAQIAKLEGGGGNSAIPSVGSVPSIGQEYVRLMREFKIQESLVELLTKQYEMASFSEAKDFSPLQVLQKAKVPERKSKPKRSLIVILATIAAFLCSLQLAFISEFFIRLPEEKRERLKSLLAGMPFQRNSDVK